MSKRLQIIIYRLILHSSITCYWLCFIYSLLFSFQVQAHEDDVDAVTFADASSQILISGADDGLCKVQDKILFTILVVTVTITLSLLRIIPLPHGKVFLLVFICSTFCPLLDIFLITSFPINHSNQFQELQEVLS